MFAVIERTIVDWCEANSILVEEKDGEWFMADENGAPEFSLTELASAVVGAVAKPRVETGA